MSNINKGETKGLKLGCYNHKCRFHKFDNNINCVLLNDLKQCDMHKSSTNNDEKVGIPTFEIKIRCSNGQAYIVENVSDIEVFMLKVNDLNYITVKQTYINNTRDCLINTKQIVSIEFNEMETDEMENDEMDNDDWRY